MSYEEQDVIWRVALASYDPREMRVWTRYLEERNPAIRCTGYRSSRPLLERLEQGDVDVLVLGGRLEDMDSIQFLPRIRGLARKPLVLLRDDGRNEKSAVESLSQEDACYLISLNPSTKLSINPLNVITFLGRYKININKIVTEVAKIRLVSASHPEKAVNTSVAPPRYPV